MKYFIVGVGNNFSFCREKEGNSNFISSRDEHYFFQHSFEIGLRETVIEDQRLSYIERSQKLCAQFYFIIKQCLYGSTLGSLWCMKYYGKMSFPH